MTDRPTDTDRPALRPAAPTADRLAYHATAATDRRPVGRSTDSPRTDRPTGLRRLLRGRSTNRPTDEPTNKPASEPTGTAPTDRPAPPPPLPAPTDQAIDQPTKAASVGMTALLVVVGVFLAIVIAAPVALSSQDLIDWASSPTGLGLNGFWATVVFIALDAAAVVCVLLAVYCAWRGETAGAFGVLVWVFAAGSAFANYQHGVRPGAPGDAWWFFPAMSIAGPALLELVIRKIREWVQRKNNRRNRRMPSFGWRRWIPGMGSWRDTYGAYRTALLLGIETVDSAIDWYHWLCPDGSPRIVKRMRELGVTAHGITTGQPPTDPGKQPADRPTGSHQATTDRPANVPAAAPTVDRQPEPTTRPTNGVIRPTVAVATQPTDRRPITPTIPAPRPTGDRPTHTAAAIANAAELRERYRSVGLPSTLGQVRNDTGWSYDKAKPAVAAYHDGADLATDRPTDDDKEDHHRDRPLATATA